MQRPGDAKKRKRKSRKKARTAITGGAIRPATPMRRSPGLPVNWLLSFHHVLQRLADGEVELGLRVGVFEEGPHMAHPHETFHHLRFDDLLGSFGTGVRVALGRVVLLRFDYTHTTDFNTISPTADFDFFFGWNF